MKSNPFLKSILRQPIRTLLMVLIIATATFALVARVTEYVIVSTEINRIEGLYRAIGNLVPISPENVLRDHDVTHAAEILANSPLVAFEDRRVFTQGILRDVMNVSSQDLRFSPSLAGLDVRSNEYYFYGTVRFGAWQPFITEIEGSIVLIINIDVEELIIGDPQVIRPAGVFVYSITGERVELTNRRDFRVILTYEEAELFRAGLHPLSKLEPDVLYLFRSTHILLRSLVGNDGILFEGICEDTRDDNLVFFADTRDTEVYRDIMAYIAPYMALAEDNHHAMMVVGTRDMTAIPRFLDPRSARLVESHMVQGGRWLTYDDYLNANPVAVIPVQMATRRGLRVGETITVNLRDLPQPTWIDRETDTVLANAYTRYEGWWAPTPQGWWATTETGSDWQNAPNYELELEIVGLFWNTPLGMPYHQYLRSEIYIPASLFPPGFGWDGIPMLSGMYNFVLTSPGYENEFLETYAAQLRALGFRPNFLENGFESFAYAAAPIRESILINLIVFSVVSVLTLTVVVILFITQWRKSLAISRALGVTAGKSLRQLMMPAVLLWIPAMIIASAAAWFFAQGQAAATLAEFEYAGYAQHSSVLLVLVTAFVAVAVVGGLALLSAAIARKPVLVQLQERVQMRRKKSISSFGDFNFRYPTGHILRHITRAPAKTGLVALTTLFFVISLGWLHHTMEFTAAEIERLWDTTIVDVEIIAITNSDCCGGEAPLGFSDALFDFIAERAPISQATADFFTTSGFVDDVYLESMWIVPDSLIFEDFEWLRYTNIVLGVSDFYGFVEGNTRTVIDDALGVPGYTIQVEFFAGFGADDFVFGGEGAVIPVLVRADSLEAEINADMRIIGTFENGVDRGVNRFAEQRSITVMPMEAFEYFIAGTAFSSFLRISYFTARGTIVNNREISDFRSQMEEMLDNNRIGLANVITPVEMVIADMELRNIIIPMEQNLALIRVLYPIAIVVAIIIAVGMFLLIVMQAIKNIAVMRALGESKGKTYMVLCGEQLLVCFASVALGWVILLVVNAFAVTSLVLAGVYVVGAIVGAVIGVFVNTSKTLMELLQVME